MRHSSLEELLIDSIDRRYKSHASKDLYDYIFSNRLFHSVDPSLIDFTLTHRDKIAAYLSSPANLQMLTEYCIRATQQYTYQRNQFINFTSAYNNRLAAEYRNFLWQLKTAIANATSAATLAKAYAAVLKHHHEQLRTILSTYCSTVSQTDLRQSPLLRSVPCQEYSAPLQLQILNVNVFGLMEPILDIGCGTEGSVVHFLRNQGYAAFGIDRLAPSAPHFFQADWLNFDYSQNSWGTILAHQSLSTHFIYYHLHLPVQAVEYARLFMKILDSLQPGGAFYYAPGLPFFEHLLEAQRVADQDFWQSWVSFAA